MSVAIVSVIIVLVVVAVLIAVRHKKVDAAVASAKKTIDIFDEKVEAQIKRMKKARKK